MDLTSVWNGFTHNILVEFAIRGGLLYLVVLYLAIIYWTVQDMHSRAESPVWALLAGILVTVFPILGLFVYLLIRPKETLADVYEHSLAQESLLADVEKNQICPGCKQKVEPDFMVCPTCRTHLKRVCAYCSRLLNPRWTVCPYCARDLEAPGQITPPTPIARTRRP